MKKKKFAIVLSGGGMTCSYGAGFLSALVKEYGVTEPDIVIAGSGGAGTAAYYVAQQYDFMVDIWENRLSNKKFINKWRLKKVLDIDYLIDEVFKKQDQLDIQKIYDSKVKFLISATDTMTGQPMYFANNDRKKADFFEVLRAAKAMPIAYNKKVKIGKSYYFDTHLTSNVELNVQKAIRSGATNVLVIANNNSGIVSRIVYNTWLRMRTKHFKNNYFSFSENLTEIYNQNVEFLLIRPKDLKIGRLTNNQDVLKKTVKRGYDDCKKNKELKKFLEEIDKAKVS